MNSDPKGSRPPVGGILETALYVADLKRSARFYERLFGFEVMTSIPRLIAMRAADKQVLLLFLSGASPDHGAIGSIHVAFSIQHDQLGGWREWLADNEIAIESESQWPQGGHSLYFRDPDGHLLEVATPGVWANY